MAFKLDDLATQRALLDHIRVGESRRAAAKLVGVSRAAMYAYMRGNPEFKLAVDRATAMTSPPRGESLTIVAEVIDLEAESTARAQAQRLGKKPPPGLSWNPHDAGSVVEHLAALMSAPGASDARVVGLARIIAARAFTLESAQAEEAGERVYVELPPKDASG